MSAQVLSSHKQWRNLREEEYEEREPIVTICVAAICAKSSTIIAMADRMLTGGLVQYQPARSKIIPITNSITAMLSGEDIALAVELIEEVKARVRASIDANPNEWFSVKATADTWRDVYVERLVRNAETSCLARYGLTIETFITKQSEFAPSFLAKLTDELDSFTIPKTEVIFAGLDTVGSGAHLYIARSADIQCQDAAGYAAIGIGAFHARSQFISSNHLASDPREKALYTTYVAKKRAEIAPGVGKDTDTYVIEALGGGSELKVELIEICRSEYEKSEKHIAGHNKKTFSKVAEKFDAALKPIATLPATQQVAIERIEKPVATPAVLPTPLPAKDVGA